MDAPWKIPDSWKWTTMGEISNIVGGGTPKTDRSEYFGGDIPWITPADLSGYSSVTISHGARNITQIGLENSSTSLMPAGTVLFSSRAPIGYVAIAANPVATNQGFKSFILQDGIDPLYVYYYLKRAKELIVSLASGTTFLEISGKKAAQIPIPIAPLEQQKQIVAEIEKQFTRLDAGVAALKRLQANLKRYRASVLKAACEGKLVPTEAELARKEGREYEPASVLLERILKERREKWQVQYPKKKYMEPKGPDTSNLPELPEGWCWATLDQLSIMITDGDHNPPHRVVNGIPHLTAKNIKYSRIDVEACSYISEKDAERVFKRYKPCEGDLIITCVGTVGRTAIVPPGIIFSADRNLAAIRLALGKDFCEYIEIYLNSPDSQEKLKNVSGSTAQPHLYLGDIRTFSLAVAPHAELYRIINEMQMKTSIIDELDILVSINIRRAERFKQTVLRGAFEGRIDYKK